MDGDAVLEVGEEMRFSYPEDRKCSYVIPAGLRLRRGEAWAIQGVSGSGKSTLMTLLAALRRFDRGSLGFRFRDEAPRFVTPTNWPATVGPSLWRRIGFAFQRPELLRSLTVGDNLNLPRALAAIVRPRGQTRPTSLFAADEWQRIQEARVWKISGGQLQRLGLLRAFAADQELVFLDEPTNNLDRSKRQEVAELILRERDRRGLILVSHDHDFLKLLPIDRSFRVVETTKDDGIERALEAAPLDGSHSEPKTARTAA